MTVNRFISWAIGVVAAVLCSIYGLFLYSIHDYDPVALLVCVDIKPWWQVWACKEMLRHASLNADEVKYLNEHGGSLQPASMADLTTADEMLTLFIARGVDINIGNPEAKGWVPLHAFAIEGDVDRIKMLLRHGARADVRDTDGFTPLDIAKQMQRKHPNEPGRSLVVQTLEVAEKK